MVAPRPVVPAAAWDVDPVLDVPPREAFFAPRERLPLRRALGRTSAELVAPYPPGVPVLAPGERVTEEVLGAWPGPARAASASPMPRIRPCGRIDVLAR